MDCIISDHSDHSSVGSVVVSPVLQLRKLNCSWGDLEEGDTPSVTTDNVARS